MESAQALEFDVFQFVGGYNYMMGTQCNYANGTWDVWDELEGHWRHTMIACPQFQTGTWHRVQWYVQRNPNTTTYNFVTLVVDGTAYSVSRSFSAKNVGWEDDLGVQYQLDVNGGGGAYEEWIDEASLTIW